MFLAGCALTFVLAACDAVIPVVPQEPFFPREPPQIGMQPVLTALGSGLLAFEDGCLWLRSADDRHLLIWHVDHRPVWREGRIAIVDAA